VQGTILFMMHALYMAMSRSETVWAWDIYMVVQPKIELKVSGLQPAASHWNTAIISKALSIGLVLFPSIGLWFFVSSKWN